MLDFLSSFIPSGAQTPTPSQTAISGSGSPINVMVPQNTNIGEILNGLVGDSASGGIPLKRSSRFGFEESGYEKLSTEEPIIKNYLIYALFGAILVSAIIIIKRSKK